MKSDYIILILICLSMITVTINSVSIPAAEKEFSLSNDLSDNVITAATIPTVTVSDTINEKEYETANGMKLVIGKVTNNENVEKGMILSIPVDDKEIDFNVTIGPGKVLSYAKIYGMIIVPKSDAVIYQDKTSYYPSGEILEVTTDGANEFYIYIGRKGMPAIVIADSVHWEYDYDKRILWIKSENEIKNILVYWGDSGKPTTFLEDMRKIEIINNNIGKLDSDIADLGKVVTQAEKPIEALKSELSELENKGNTTVEERIAIERNITELNSTASDLENRITANVLLSPSFAVAWIILAAILIILLIDISLFKGRKK